MLHDLLDMVILFVNRQGGPLVPCGRTGLELFERTFVCDILLLLAAITHSSSYRLPRIPLCECC